MNGDPVRVSSCEVWSEVPGSMTREPESTARVTFSALGGGEVTLYLAPGDAVSDSRGTFAAEVETLPRSAVRQAPETGAETETPLQDAGYPRGLLESLLDCAEHEFEARIDEHGAGKNWAGSEPRWDIQKAVDEAFSMRDPAQNGEYSHAEEHAANALNHLLFALENVHG